MTVVVVVVVVVVAVEIVAVVSTEVVELKYFRRLVGSEFDTDTFFL